VDHGLYTTVDNRSGEVVDSDSRLSHFKAMVRVQVDPNKQKPRLVFSRDLISLGLVPSYFPIDTLGGASQTSLCAPRTESMSCTEEATECEEIPMHRWLEPNDCRSTDLDDTANKSQVTQEAMGDDSSYWPGVLTSTGLEESKAQYFDGRGQSTSQGQDPFMQSVKKIVISKDHEQHEQSAAHPIKEERKGETESDDVMLGMAHPIPRLPSSYMAGSNFISFLGPETPSEATSSFSTPDDSLQSLESLSNCEIGQKQEWTAYDLETPAFPLRSPEESPAHAVNTFLPVSGPATLPPWSTTFGAQATWDVQHQSTDNGQVFWAVSPYVLGSSGLYDHGNGGFDQVPRVSKDFHGLPLQGNEYQDYTAQAMSFSQTKLEHLGFAIVREPCAGDQGCNQAQTYHGNSYTHHCMDPKHAIRGSHRFQEQRNNRQIDRNSENRDAFLVEWKRRGFSYKAIKRIGGFKEAESTLRGRFRTLTKSKDQRVRRPQWQDKDVSVSQNDAIAVTCASAHEHIDNAALRCRECLSGSRQSSS
jgi:hypothetical protein